MSLEVLGVDEYCFEAGWEIGTVSSDRYLALDTIVCGVIKKQICKTKILHGVELSTFYVQLKCDLL